MALTSSPPQVHFDRPPVPVFEPLESISSYPSHLVRWRECADSKFKLSSYVFIGQRTTNFPVRMAFVAGVRLNYYFEQRDFGKVFVGLEGAPWVGFDSPLFFFAVTTGVDTEMCG